MVSRAPDASVTSVGPRPARGVRSDSAQIYWRQRLLLICRCVVPFGTANWPTLVPPPKPRVTSLTLLPLVAHGRRAYRGPSRVSRVYRGKGHDVAAGVCTRSNNVTMTFYTVRFSMGSSLLAEETMMTKKNSPLFAMSPESRFGIAMRQWQAQRAPNCPGTPITTG